MQGFSIRAKLTLYSAATVAAGGVAAAAALVLVVAHHRDEIRSRLDQRMAELTRPVLATLDEPASLQTTVQLVLSDPRIKRVAVIVPDNDVRLWAPGSAPTSVPTFAPGYDSVALRSVKVLPNGSQLVVWYDEEALYHEFYRGGVLVALSLGAALLVALFTAGAAARWVARPVSELAALARSIPESGDYQVDVVPKSRDELGQLGLAFGEMLAKIERRERAMETARQDAELAAAEARRLATQAQATADALAVETEARERTQRQLEQAQKMEALGRLAGGVAHDFNNLLLVIGTYANELSTRLGGEDLEAIQQVDEAVRRAIKLTQQLLSFSRQPRGEPTNVDVGQMLSRLQRLLERLIGEDIALTVHGSRLSLVVRAPEGALESAVMNLVVNARDALPNGGSIRVSMAPSAPPKTVAPDESASERWMVLAVEDDGEGMDEATRRRAFEPFFTTKPTGEGTGLGLTLVYALCQQLGGEVVVDSEVGRGTRFELFLPLVETESGFSSDLPTLTPLPSEEGRILVAEDDPQVRRLIMRVLTQAGFVVEAVGDGQAALERLVDGPLVDLVVSDVVMPRMGGLELAQALQKADVEVPVLFISGYPAHPGQQSEQFPPELPLLRKPFTAQALRRIVRTMLGRNPMTPPPFNPNQGP